MLVSSIKSALIKLKESYEKGGSVKDEQKKAEYFCAEVKAKMDAIREDVDKLEALVDDELWSLPKFWRCFL